MKNVLNIISKVVLVISIVALAVVVLANLIPIIRILFFGMTVGSDSPESIWWEKKTLHGFEGISLFYKVWGDLVLMFELPIAALSIIYLIFYNKLIRKRFEKE